jgi:release factor glutamine methyltransferase
VELNESDLFSAVSGHFDLIVANLPYIPDSEQAELSREVKRDPALALYGGKVGTEIIEKFLGEAPTFLIPGGKIALEFGIGQEKQLSDMASDNGFQEVNILKDLSGTDRFLLATKPL